MGKIINYLYQQKYDYRENLREIFDSLAVKLYFISILSVNIFIWLFAFYIDNKIDNELAALHYNVDFGINLLGDVKQIYIIPWLGLLILFINFILFLHIKKNREKLFLSHLLLFSVLLVNLTLLAAMASIYLVNFR